MLEALFGIIFGIVEALVSLIGGIIEAIVGLFAVGGEALTFGELIIILFAFIAEMIFWFFLFIAELVKALFQWRKPRKVLRPKLYTRKSQRKKDDDLDNDKK